jgi:hypothetical protein
MPYQLLEQLYLIDLCAGCKKIWTYLRLIKPVWALFGLNFCLSPVTSWDNPIAFGAQQLAQVCQYFRHRPLALFDSEYGCAQDCKSNRYDHC